MGELDQRLVVLETSQDGLRERLASVEEELRATRAELAGLRGDLRELVAKYDAERRGLRWVGAALLGVAALAGWLVSVALQVGQLMRVQP